jgi:RNA-binding protein
MPELVLTRELALTLRARAHNLDPVVLVGVAGLTEAVVKEIDRALAAHGLVKIKAGRMEGEEREAAFSGLAQRLEAARVQEIGHLLVLYRPADEKPAKKPARKAPARKADLRNEPARKAPARKPGARPARPAAPAKRGRRTPHR